MVKYFMQIRIRYKDLIQVYEIGQFLKSEIIEKVKL
jgi:hypothetical protein